MVVEHDRHAEGAVVRVNPRIRRERKTEFNIPDAAVALGTRIVGLIMWRQRFLELRCATVGRPRAVVFAELDVDARARDVAAPRVCKAHHGTVDGVPHEQTQSWAPHFAEKTREAFCAAVAEVSRPPRETLTADSRLDVVIATGAVRALPGLLTRTRGVGRAKQASEALPGRVAAIAERPLPSESAAFAATRRLGILEAAAELPHEKGIRAFVEVQDVGFAERGRGGGQLGCAAH